MGSDIVGQCGGLDSRGGECRDGQDGDEGEQCSREGREGGHCCEADDDNGAGVDDDVGEEMKAG